MRRDAALTAFEALAELHRSHDVTRFGGVFTDDVEYADDGWHETLYGLASLEQFFRALWKAFPDFSIEIIAGPYLGPAAA
jgi:SnoaL-like protein